MVQSKKIAINWSIKNLDADEVIRPQFPIGDSGVSFVLGSELAEQNRFGFQDSITNWTNGKTRVFTFQTELYARNVTEGPDVLKKFKLFENLATKTEDYGRPPICLFNYGNLVNETVIVESIDPIIKRNLSNGNPQHVILNITLRKYTAFSQKQIDPGKPARESLYLVASAAEKSYEAIAKRFYGDPLMGDRLRKRHPENPLAPPIGSIVKVPARSLILQEVVQPSSHILSLTDEDSVALFETLLEDRNSRKLVVVK